MSNKEPNILIKNGEVYLITQDGLLKYLGKYDPKVYSKSVPHEKQRDY